MKKEIYIEEIGNVIYNESAMTGSRSIIVNGKPATKLDKTTYIIKPQNEEEKEQTLKVEGSILTGVILKHKEHRYELSPKTAWYEYLLAALAFIFDIIWGNSASLCAIFPVVGGAIGGAICGGMIIVNVMIMKKFKNPLIKVLVSLVVTALTILALFLIALLFLSGQTFE